MDQHKSEGLTDDQRDEVRRLLSQYVRPAKRDNGDKKFIPDPLRDVPPGTLVEIQRCGGDAKQHRAIKECRTFLAPYLIDKIEIDPKELAAEIKKNVGGTAKFERDAVVITLHQGRPVAAVRIGMTGNVVTSIHYEVA